MTTLDTRDNFPIKLNGVHYEIDLRSYRRNTIEATRAQQDQSSESSEQTLNNQYLWKRTGEDFDFGRGQKWFDADEFSSRKRHEDSLNIDIWEDRQLTLLNEVNQVVPNKLYSGGALNGTQMQIAGSWVFHVFDSIILVRNFRGNPVPTPTGFSIDVVDDNFAVPWTLTNLFASGGTYTGFTPNANDVITSLVNDGNNFYATFSITTGVWKFTGASGPTFTATNIGVGSKIYESLQLVGNKLFAVHRDTSTSEYKLVRITGASTPSDVLIDTWPNDLYPRITGSITGPDGIYWSGVPNLNTTTASFPNRKSYIYRSTFDETTAEYTPLSPIVSLPEGEIITTLYEYAGYILIGTSKGFRLAQFTQTGGINYGPLNDIGSFATRFRAYEQQNLAIQIGVTRFEGEENYVWFNWSKYEPIFNQSTNKRYFGLGRIDLGQLVNDLQPAWNSDLMFEDLSTNVAASQVQGFTSYNNEWIFCTDYAGVYKEKSSAKAATGFFKTGQVNFGTAEQKRFARLELKASATQTLADKIDFKVIPENASATIYTGSFGNGQTAKTFTLTNSYGEYAQVEYKFSRNSSNASPVLNRWTLRALPVPERQEEIFLPIILKDNVAHNLSSVTGLNPYDEFQTLRALLQSRVVVPLTMGDETVEVIVDSIITGQDQGARMDRWNHDESWAEGIWYVKCITISATGVTSTPVVVNNLVGPQGAKGDTGLKGDTGDTGSSGVIAVTAPITNSGTPTSANIGVTAGSTSAAGVLQLTDSTSSTSTTTAATPNSVKSAFDIGNAAVPKSGGTMTGDLSVPSVIVTGTAGAGDIILPSQSAVPASPSAGNLALYSSTEAARIRPSWVTPNGTVRSADMLPWDRVFWLCTPGLTTQVNTIGCGQLAGANTGTVSNGDGFTGNITSAATALAFARLRQPTQMVTRNTGYFLHTRVAFNDASYDNTGGGTGCGIYGLHTNTGGFTTPATPTASPAIVAFYRGHINGGRTDTNWQFVTSNGSAITFSDTGMAFATGKTYDFYVWTPAGGSSLFWQVDNVTDSTTFSNSTSSTLPSAGTAQGCGPALQTVDAVARSFTWSRSYVEESG